MKPNTQREERVEETNQAKKKSERLSLDVRKLNMQTSSLVEPNAPPDKPSIFHKLLKLLHITGQRNVDKLTCEQSMDAKKKWEQRKESVQKRIEQYKTSGH